MRTLVEQGRYDEVWRDDERYAEERIAAAAALDRLIGENQWGLAGVLDYVGTVLRTAGSWPLHEDEEVVVQFAEDWGGPALLGAIADTLRLREEGRLV